jgi:hypothetical protein
MIAEKKKEWYMGWVSDKSPQDSVRDAIQRYMKKYGNPPSEILIAPEDKLEPMEGFHFVVRVDPLVCPKNLLLGVIDNEELEASIRLEG